MLELAEALAARRAAPQARRSCSPPSPPRSRACSAASTSASTRSSRAGRIAANLNIDGINIWGRASDVGFIGLGKSSLDDVVVAVAKAQGRTVTADDQSRQGQLLSLRPVQLRQDRRAGDLPRSRASVHPGHDAAWGRALQEKYTKERYHQPSDQIDDSWNLDGAVDDVQLMTVTLLRIADAPKLPEWHHGDEFEAARKKALAR